MLFRALLFSATVFLFSCDAKEHQKEMIASRLVGEKVYCSTKEGCGTEEFHCISQSGKQIYCPADHNLDCFVVYPPPAETVKPTAP